MRRFIASTVTPSTRPPFTGSVPIPGIRQVNRAEIPLHFLHGRYDYTVSYTLTKHYFEVFQAPEKVFITFGHSAHSPHFGEPERVREVPERILKGRED
ncbi:hypothetical protein DSECCO2_461350 [anaerobic digester metagenome]